MKCNVVEREAIPYLKDLLADVQHAVNDKYECSITCAETDVINIKHVIETIKKYEEALQYISEITQPDGGYVSRLDGAVTKAKQVLEPKCEVMKE